MSSCTRFVALASSAALAAGLLVAAAPRALSAEGALPIRAGDTVRGTLLNCYDRQVSEVQLLRGEVFQVRLHSTHAPNDSVNLRIYDPDGFLSSSEARVRQQGGEVVAGPFRAWASGAWRIEIGTLTAHGAGYEAVTRVKRTRKTTARLGGRKTNVTVAAAAGATIQVRGNRVPTLALRRPSETNGIVLAPGTAEFAAISGKGLAAPLSGNYEFTAIAGGNVPGNVRARIVVTPPGRVTGEVVEFPSLPDDANAVATWLGTGGWLLDHDRAAPDAEGHIAPPPPAAPKTSPWTGSIVEDCPAPGQVTGLEALADVSLFVGPASGVGLPSPGIPRLDDVLRLGRLEPTSSGPSYVYVRSSQDLGDVTTRVRFLIDGRATVAPVAIDGRVTVRWTDQGGSQNLDGNWTLSHDADRRVQVLDGTEFRFPEPGRTLTSSAKGFALPGLPGAWPQGSLTLAVDDPARGTDFLRRETYTGAASVNVDVLRGDGSADSNLLTFPGN